MTAPGPPLVDWELASRTGVRLARPGPEVSAAEARVAVADLRRCAVEARGHVRACTGLDAPAVDADVAVVDRSAWVRSGALGMRHLLEPLQDRLGEHGRAARTPAGVRAVTARVAGLELGAGLAFLSGKVLGQYELFPAQGPDADRPGRPLLVAPNVVQVERELDVVPADFRLWVCLHEETHRVQFGAVPWLRGYLVEQVGELVVGLDAESEHLGERAGAALAAVSAALRGVPGQSLAEALQSPEQAARIAVITALMSLLEGHADVVMDEVGPEVVPTVAAIRARFQRRREQPGRVDAAIRRLLGFDAKLKQYADGARFVRGVVDRVGMDGFNHVWSSAATLPTTAELADPDAWVTRVHPDRQDRQDRPEGTELP